MHVQVQKITDLLSKYRNSIPILLLVLIFFSCSIILTYDSAHYLSYVTILEGNAPTSTWDIARGPIFPMLISLSDIIFGKTSTGILICTSIFYLVFCAICSIIINELTTTCKHKKRIRRMLLALAILNPLIFGYFHVLLTEFIAITITMFNILIAYRWISLNDKMKKITYLLLFTISAIFCYHLKQPYITLSILPLIASIFISIFKNPKRDNIAIQISALIIPLLSLLISICAWNGILNVMNADRTNDRDPSSLLSKQIISTYQIEDTDNTSSPLHLLLTTFLKNPVDFSLKYLKNYCGLTSLCKVISENTVDYTATGEIDLIHTFENETIGYATYQRQSNLFPMQDSMQNQASYYSTYISNSIFAKIMRFMQIPTNILFKLCTLLCVPTLIILCISRYLSRTTGSNPIFYLSFILLFTASFHMLISATTLIIDRYAIEAFIPSLFGMFGTFLYIRTGHHMQKLTKHSNK